MLDRFDLRVTKCRRLQPEGIELTIEVRRKPIVKVHNGHPGDNPPDSAHNLKVVAHDPCNNRS
ncbi:MAG TPA: hypothetical protein VNK04_03980 [Gemmataceae bacterium]|nr:hypothetical protein [Gemmataceae bacterium]